MKKIKTKQITLIAIMGALATLFDLMLAKGNIKVSIHALPLLITGIFFGPFIGLLVGIIAGLLSQMLTYGLTITTPFWLLAYGSWGFISGLFKKTIKTKINNQHNCDKIIFLTVVLSSISAYLCNTLASFSQIWLMNDPYYTNASIITDMIPRFVIMFVMMFAHSVLVNAIVKSLSSVIIE